MLNMRIDITVEKIIEEGDVKLNKSELARQYGCCWETIDRRLNPDKYKKEKKRDFILRNQMNHILKNKKDSFQQLKKYTTY